MANTAPDEPVNWATQVPLSDEPTNWAIQGYSSNGAVAADGGDATRIGGTASSVTAAVGSGSRLLNPRSCVTCRKRKVKCDKLHPCSNCSRAHIECVFPSPGRAPRRSKKTGFGPRDKELLERLRHLESVVKGLGVGVPEGESADPIRGGDGTEALRQRGGLDGANEAPELLNDIRDMHNVISSETLSSVNLNDDTVGQPSMPSRRSTKTPWSTTISRTKPS